MAIRRLPIYLVALVNALLLLLPTVSAFPQSSDEQLKPCGDAYYYPSKVGLPRDVTTPLP